MSFEVGKIREGAGPVLVRYRRGSALGLITAFGLEAVPSDHGSPL